MPKKLQFIIFVGLAALTYGTARAEVTACNLVQKADVERILASSAKAFETWKDVAPSVREKMLIKAAALMEERAKELQDVLIDEAGSITNFVLLQNCFL